MDRQMKLLSAAVGKTQNSGQYNTLGIVFLSPNPGAEDLYDSVGYRLTVYRPTEMVCTSGRTLERFDDIVKFAEAIDQWATDRQAEREYQGIGLSGDRVQVVDYDDASLIFSMKFESVDYVPNIDMRGARKQGED